MFENNLLTLLILLPTVGAIALLLLPKSQSSRMQNIATGIAAGEFVLSLFLLCYFDESSHLLQLVQKVPWIQSLGVSYFVGVDGISLWLVLLTTFLTPIVLMSSEVKTNTKAYYACFLILETAMIGTFLALDLFLFYVFWEMMLIPMYLIIGVWGGARRFYATMKFVIYTLAGGILMLLGIIFLVYLHYEQFGVLSASLLDIYAIEFPFHAPYLGVESLLFIAFSMAFLIKVPMFPFHTWLPDAHVEAPTGGSIILAGVLLKMGSYGFLRFAIPLFPQALKLYMPLLIAISIIGIIYGAFLALAQKDMKKLVAYSSVSHMGLVMIGLLVLNVNGVSGSIYQMLCHGLSTGALFLMVGMLYERRHTKEIADFGGITKIIPNFAVFFLIVCLSSIALPTTNGFIGEFLILLGTFQKSPVLAALGGTTVILGAYYILRMYQKVMFGPVTKDENKKLKDLSWKEMSVLIPIVVMIFWMGIYPQTFLSKMEKSVDYLVEHHQKYELGVYEK